MITITILITILTIYILFSLINFIFCLIGIHLSTQTRNIEMVDIKATIYITLGGFFSFVYLVYLAIQVLDEKNKQQMLLKKSNRKE